MVLLVTATGAGDPDLPLALEIGRLHWQPVCVQYLEHHPYSH